MSFPTSETRIGRADEPCEYCEHDDATVYEVVGSGEVTLCDECAFDTISRCDYCEDIFALRKMCCPDPDLEPDSSRLWCSSCDALGGADDRS